MNETTKKVLSNLNLICGEGKLRNTALLLFGKNPAKFFTSVQFRIGRFGRDEADLMFQDIVDGNIIQMTDRVIEVLKSKYLISPVHYEGLQRIEPLEIPEDALRESLFNSIVHKLYTGVHIQMKVYNDRIRLWNPGTLPEGMTIEQLLGDHASHPRNRLIAETFYRARFIESWGRGIHKIYEGMTKAGLRKPEFTNEAGGVTLIIYRPNIIEPLCHLSMQFENFLRFQILDEHNASSFFICLEPRFLNSPTKVLKNRNNKPFTGKLLRLGSTIRFELF